MSTLLTPQIVTGDDNIVVHNEWDNLNKITTSIHGSNVVNSAGGIIIQKRKLGSSIDSKRALPLLDRSKTRSLKVDTPETLPPVHVHNRVGPKFPAGASFIPPADVNDEYKTSLQSYYIWLLCRRIGSGLPNQTFPPLGGFTSATGVPPAQKTTIDYYTPIDQPITEYAVVEELLRRSEEATAEVGQQYTLNTFDLGVCMKALPLVWKYPVRYKLHVITPGPFHTGMNFIGMLTGHKCRGSGYKDILLEAGLVTSGSLNAVLKGKAYNKALFCLKTVVEALERLLIEQYIKENGDMEAPVVLQTLVQSLDRERLEIAVQDRETMALVTKYQAFEESVRRGHLGKTAMFWMSVIDQAHLLFMHQHSVKTNNLRLFHHCNGEMADIFFAFDGHNYSR